MCIINEKANVSDTHIFVAADNLKKTQLTIYSNNVNNKSKNNMMILPIPGAFVKFVDLSKYADLFNGLEKLFPIGKSARGMLSMNNSYSDSYIPTSQVGSYNACVAKNIQDLARINPFDFGTVNEFTKEILTKFYPDYQFVICKLKTGEVKYHPFAYVHEYKDRLFIPTRHLHGSHYHHIEDEWNHDIYVLNTFCKDSSYVKIEKNFYNYDTFNFLQGFDAETRGLSRLKINGVRVNDDIWA